MGQREREFVRQVYTYCSSSIWANSSPHWSHSIKYSSQYKMHIFVEKRNMVYLDGF